MPVPKWIDSQRNARITEANARRSVSADYRASQEPCRETDACLCSACTAHKYGK